MNDVAQIDFKQGAPKVETPPTGGTALRFDEPFRFRVDLKSRDIDPHEFDLITLEVKADRAAFLRVAVENVYDKHKRRLIQIVGGDTVAFRVTALESGLDAFEANV